MSDAPTQTMKNARDAMFDQSTLLHLFEYKDGKLYWKNPTSRAVKFGSEAGTPRKDGRRQIILFGKHYLTSRLVYFMFNGEFPEIVDHINRDYTDNRIENLRSTTRAQNNWNRKNQHNSTSGHKNVYWHSQSQTWRVRVSVNGKRIGCGQYKDLELAQLVAIEARNKYHGVFAYHGC